MPTPPSWGLDSGAVAQDATTVGDRPQRTEATPSSQGGGETLGERMARFRAAMQGGSSSAHGDATMGSHQSSARGGGGVTVVDVDADVSGGNDDSDDGNNGADEDAAANAAVAAEAATAAEADLRVFTRCASLIISILLSSGGYSLS